MRAMPPCSDGPIIDHIPEEGDDSVGAKRLNSKQRLNVKISAKRNKSDQILHTSRRKLSEATSLGVLLSDLLRTSDRSQDEIPVQNIKKRQHRKSETMEQHDADITEVIEEPKMEKVKRRSKNKPKPIPETQSPFLEPKTESKNVVKSPPKETVARPVGSKITAISKAQSYANYEMFFPELGAAPAQKVTSSKGPATIPACAPKLSKSSESFSNPYDVEIIKVKKKPSKKDRRKSKDKSTTEKSKPIDIKSEKTNVWGVPLKSPEEYAMCATSPLSPDRMTSPFASATYVEPKSPPSRDGVWQNPPLSTTYGSPPFRGQHRSESATSTDPKPIMFIDILQDEIRNREIAEKISKKSMASIQLEETAMNELKLHYESSNRSKATFFTVSRVDHVTSKEIEDFRKSANQK